MKVHVDTNVLVDFVCNRQGFVDEAKKFSKIRRCQFIQQQNSLMYLVSNNISTFLMFYRLHCHPGRQGQHPARQGAAAADGGRVSLHQARLCHHRPARQTEDRQLQILRCHRKFLAQEVRRGRRTSQASMGVCRRYSALAVPHSRKQMACCVPQSGSGTCPSDPSHATRHARIIWAKCGSRWL